MYRNCMLGNTWFFCPYTIFFVYMVSIITTDIPPQNFRICVFILYVWMLLILFLRHYVYFRLPWVRGMGFYHVDLGGILIGKQKHWKRENKVDLADFYTMFLRSVSVNIRFTKFGEFLRRGKVKFCYFGFGWQYSSK